MRDNLAEEVRNHFQDPAHAIFAAIRDGKVARLKSLLDTSSPSPNLDHDHQIYGPPLHFASWCGDINAIEVLLAAGADPEAINRRRGPTHGRPIDSAAGNGHMNVIKLLWPYAVRDIELGRISPDKTVLRLAAGNGYARIVEYLLPTWDGWTDQHKTSALEHACSNWQFTATAVILSNHPFPVQTLEQALDDALDANALVGPTPRDCSSF